MIVSTIFSSFVITDKLTFIDNKDLEEYAYSLKKQDKGVVKSNFLGWQSDILQTPNDQVSMLAITILNRINLIKKDLGFLEKTDVYLNNLWININQKASFNRPHLHPHATFSGVYYVKCNSNSGDLVFKHPAVAQQYSLKEETVDKYNDFNASTWAIVPEESKLIIFPSWLEHYVEPNPKDEDRISIAFNADIKVIEK
jgi:uncharacterized protein (TIGR02466 family)